ncbi:MAG: hypothetical protein JWP64_5980 [Pseudonocardia sp.]|jgi:hypothetical protein|nr:hypothetical protein [Pseudonocardia sp.]MDT7698959.1 hypothetical protein [Pseudonocardiales bacterium]
MKLSSLVRWSICAAAGVHRSGVGTGNPDGVLTSRLVDPLWFDGWEERGYGCHLP